MKSLCQLLICCGLLVVSPAGLTQPGDVRAMWTTVRRLEAQPATFSRDTLLVRAYTDFIPQLIKKEPPDSGLFYSRAAYALAQSRGWQRGMLLALVRQASCLNIANRHYEALRTAFKGLALAEQQHDVYFQAMFHRSLGNNYDMLDNYNQAIPHYQTCLRLTENVPALQHTRGNALVELGDAYRFHHKRPDRAKALIEQAIAIYAVGDSSSLGYAYDYYGQALTDLHRYSEAGRVFRQAERYNARFGKEYLMPELLLHEAELYVTEKKYEQALTKARECLTYSRRKNSLYGQRGACRVLYESYKALDRPGDALANHEQFLRLNDAMNEASNNQRFRAVQADYALQAKQVTIDRLTIDRQLQTERLLVASLAGLLLFSGYAFWQNRRLQQKNRAISEASLRGQTLERQRVAADLHDNLGTTLSALRWSLDAMDKTKLSAPEQAVYATISQQVGQAYNDVRLLSHNLLPDELAKQGLAAALTQLVGKLNRNTPVQFSLTGADALPRLNRQTEFELYSICLELVNNTIKHAHASEGFIDLTAANDMIHLTIGDNGAGVSNQQTDGRGLHNIAARVDSLAGTWVIDSTPGGGVQNRITVPIRWPGRVL